MISMIIPDMGDAMLFAMEAHKDQTRKYTGEPYLVHCAEVAALVYRYCGTTAMVCAAWLHDVVEDCNVPLSSIQQHFGDDVFVLVDQLTERKTLGNRAQRKASECARWSYAHSSAKTIKLADLISNTRSIVAHDPNFAKVYLEEKRALLPNLVGGNPLLWEIAHQQANREVSNT